MPDDGHTNQNNTSDIVDNKIMSNGSSGFNQLYSNLDRQGENSLTFQINKKRQFTKELSYQNSDIISVMEVTQRGSAFPPNNQDDDLDNPKFSDFPR